MVLLTRHEESIKARLCFTFYNNNTSIQIQSIFLSIQYNLLQALNLFELLLLLCAKSFPKFSGFQNLENLCYSFFSSLLPLPKRVRLRLTVWIFFVSVLPFPKEQRTNRLNSFVSPFSLVKEFKTIQSENSFDSSISLIQKFSKD